VADDDEIQREKQQGQAVGVSSGSRGAIAQVAEERAIKHTNDEVPAIGRNGIIND
jgi:uncharacterized protein YoaH (UPF0181 family)